MRHSDYRASLFRKALLARMEREAHEKREGAKEGRRQGADEAQPREPVLERAAVGSSAGREDSRAHQGAPAKARRGPKPFAKGHKVRKVKGYPFGDGNAIVVAVFWHRGKWKMIAEHPDGWLHIFDCEQMELV